MRQFHNADGIVHSTASSSPVADLAALRVSRAGLSELMLLPA